MLAKELPIVRVGLSRLLDSFFRDLESHPTCFPVRRQIQPIKMVSKELLCWLPIGGLIPKDWNTQQLSPPQRLFGSVQC